MYCLVSYKVIVVLILAQKVWTIGSKRNKIREQQISDACLVVCIIQAEQQL